MCWFCEILNLEKFSDLVDLRKGEEGEGWSVGIGVMIYDGIMDGVRFEGGEIY